MSSHKKYFKVSFISSHNSKIISKVNVDITLNITIIEALTTVLQYCLFLYAHNFNEFHKFNLSKRIQSSVADM